MSKKKTKVSIHFTIDKEINERLNIIVEKECLNRSLLIQTLIDNYLKEK